MTIFSTRTVSEPIYNFTMSAPPPKRRRQEIPANVKKEICQEKIKNPKMSQSEIVKFVKAKFNLDVGRSTIADILKNKDKWLSTSGTDQTTRTRNAKFEELERALLLWFNNARKNNLDINDSLLIIHAKKLGEKMGVDDDFGYSSGWVRNFKERNGIKRFIKHGEAASVNLGDVDQGRQEMRELLKDVDPNDIYNCDETGLFYRMDTNSTLDTEECSGRKQPKDRMTILLTCNATGTDKRKPLIIWKYKRPRCFGKAGSGFDPNIYCDWYFNKKAWMTGVIFKEWITNFDRQMRAARRHVVLVLDNAPSHMIPPLTNVKVHPLPPNTTSHLQPLDAGVIRNFKLKYRTRQMQYYYDCYEDGTPAALNPRLGISFIEKAWKDVKESTIANCWKKTEIIEPLSQQVTVQTDQHDEDRLQELLDNLNAETTSSSVIDMDENLPVESELTEDEIIQAARRQEEEEEEDSNAPEEESEHQVITAKQGRQCLNILEQLLQQHQDDVFDMKDLENMEAIREKLSLYSRKCLINKKIDDFFKPAK